MKKLFLFTSICLFLTLTSSAQKGFLGKNKAITLDLNSLIIDRELDLGLNLMINPNVNLIPSLGLISYNSRTPYRDYIWGGDSSYIARRGFSIGLRLLATTYLTGQVAPLGHYYGYGYKFSKFRQIETKVPFRDALATKEQYLNSHDIYLFYGKSFLLSESLYLSIDIPIGMIIFSGYDTTISNYGAEMPRSYLGPEIGFDSGRFGWYIRPNLRLGYFF